MDKNTKLRDVYALSLSAGQKVQFALDGHEGRLGVILANPGTSSFEGGTYSAAFSLTRTSGYPVDGPTSGWRKTFTAAVTGTYHFAIMASGSRQTYTLEVTQIG